MVVQGNFLCVQRVWGRRVYLVWDMFLSIFLVCYRIPEGSGVNWGCRWISPSCRKCGGENRVVYPVWECFFQISLVFYSIPEGSGGSCCRMWISLSFSECEGEVRRGSRLEMIPAIVLSLFRSFRVCSFHSCSVGCPFWVVVPAVRVVQMDFLFVQRVWA